MSRLIVRPPWLFADMHRWPITKLTVIKSTVRRAGGGGGMEQESNKASDSRKSDFAQPSGGQRAAVGARKNEEYGNVPLTGPSFRVFGVRRFIAAFFRASGTVLRFRPFHTRHKKRR